MNAVGNHYEIRKEQGFAVYVLRSAAVELAVVPELGARIISLKDLGTGREWLWHPQAGMRLFRNRIGDDFATSPLVGIDECFPTIAPCRWQDRELPDHGELWSASWQVTAPAWEAGVLRTSTKLPISPFGVERTIELQDNWVRLRYAVHNWSSRPERFLWALHPLLRMQAGDRLELPTSTQGLLNGKRWNGDLSMAMSQDDCVKWFASPLQEGCAAVCNGRTTDRLEFEWNAAENNTLGLWHTRGGWHGHTQFAIEPTNAAADTLATAARQNDCGVVPAASSIEWQIGLRVGA